MTQLNGESLQGSAAAVEQLAHWALVWLPADFNQRQAAHAFVDGVIGRKLKQHFLIGCDKLLNEALNQVLKVETAKAAAGSPAWQGEVTRTQWEHTATCRATQEWRTCMMAVLERRSPQKRLSAET
jgi:hypothetical protein